MTTTSSDSVAPSRSSARDEVSPRPGAVRRLDLVDFLVRARIEQGTGSGSR